MRILYDGTIYSMQAAGGINRYFANLIANLPETVVPTLLTRQRRKLNWPTHPNLRTVQRSLAFRPGRIARQLENAYYRTMSRPSRYDLLHPTYFWLASGRALGDYRCPIVVTVYDMIYELFGEEVETEARYVIAQKKKCILAAQAILCISESAKRDLLSFYPQVEDKVTVTPLASDMRPEMSYGLEPVPARPYFLYVGMRMSYKNFDGLLRAFRQVASTNPDVALCVVGSAFTEAENQKVAELGLLGRVEHYGAVGNNHLAKLYRCSLAFVYPSLYEGFGIPLLEAMSCGTVVVAADRSSIPEVVQDAGVLFDPEAPDVLADILLMLAADPEKRQQYIQKGFGQAQNFSWQKTAAQTLAVYNTLAA